MDLLPSVQSAAACIPFLTGRLDWQAGHGCNHLCKISYHHSVKTICFHMVTFTDLNPRHFSVIRDISRLFLTRTPVDFSPVETQRAVTSNPS